MYNTSKRTIIKSKESLFTRNEPVDIIKDKAIKRKLIEMSNEISELSFDPMTKTDWFYRYR